MLVFVSRKDISAQHTENVNSKLGLMVLRDMQWAEGRGSAVGRGQGKGWFMLQRRGIGLLLMKTHT